MNERPKVIVYSPFQEEVLHALREVCEVITFDAKSRFRDQMAAHLPDAFGLLGFGLKVDAALLDSAPNLRIVSNYSVGYDNLNVPELTRRGILAANTPDVLTETTADLVFGLMLATARRLPELDRYVKEGKWKGQLGDHMFGTDLYGKTLGVIGMGRIGAAIARRAKLGFGMPVLYYNRSRHTQAEAEFGAQYTALDDLLREADFVCLMTPLSPETVKLMGEREFGLMKRSAIFINGSRGQTVDEEALIRALESKRIASAGLDVYEKEPLPEGHPFLRMDNIVTLPHAGSATFDTRLAMEKLAVENVVCAVQGKRPPALINQEVWGIR